MLANMEKIEVGEVQVERLDDIPVIFGHLQKMHIQVVIDRVIETHGNWDYALFRQQGYFIGSGTVESSCKQVVTMRLKAPGARWTQNGALATAKARTAWLNGYWDHLAALPLAA